MKWFAALVAILLFHSWAFGTAAGQMKLVGVVRSFDTKKLMIESRGYLYTIPRSAYPKSTYAGEEIYIPMTEKEIAQLPKGKPVTKHK